MFMISVKFLSCTVYAWMPCINKILLRKLQKVYYFILLSNTGLPKNLGGRLKNPRKPRIRETKKNWSFEQYDKKNWKNLNNCT